MIACANQRAAGAMVELKKCQYARSPDLPERERITFLLLQELLAELFRRHIREVDALTSDAKPGMALSHGEQLNI
jgi:hypothetical protein